MTDRSCAADGAPIPVEFASFEYSGHDPAAGGVPGPREYSNPILAGFYPDPSLCCVGSDFYLVNSSFAYLPGLPVFHSRDLVHWVQIGNIVDRPRQLPFEGMGISRGLFAPTIREHYGVFYVICTLVDGGGNFLMTSSRPEGPWSDPVWLGFSGIDPSLYFDEDGRTWITYNGEPMGPARYDGHRAIWLQEYDAARRTLKGPARVIVDAGSVPSRQPIWIEGPHLFRRGGWIYLICAEGGTAENHSEVVFRSRDLEGPFIPWERNPILTQRNLPAGRPFPVTSTGHADIIKAADGSWWAVFLGCRPYDSQALSYATGRETFLLRVQWTDDGWPVILREGEVVPLRGSVPVLTQGLAGDPLTGDFAIKDDFHERVLAPSWISPRTLPGNVASLTAAPGRLTVWASDDTLSGKSHPAFLARRVQHSDFAVTTVLSRVPSGASAGLAAFQSEGYHIYWGARLTPSGWELFAERVVNSKVDIAARTVVGNVPALGLRMGFKGGRAVFSYSPDTIHWVPVTDSIDASFLTTRVAGGFVGAVVGLHARREAVSSP